MISAVTRDRGAPPSALTSHTPRWPPRSERNATSRPSGEKAGRSSMALPEVSGVNALMSACASQMLRKPPRVELKAMRVPSGDHAGSLSPDEGSLKACNDGDG